MTHNDNVIIIIVNSNAKIFGVNSEYFLAKNILKNMPYNDELIYIYCEFYCKNIFGVNSE